jgi:hypothetical protein
MRVARLLVAPSLCLLLAAVAGSASAEDAAAPFPADNALTALDGRWSRPAYIGPPVRVTRVDVDSKAPVLTKAGVRTYATRLTWTRTEKDRGDRRFLLVRAPSSSALCGFFTTLFTKARASQMQKACKSQGKPDLNVYAIVEYEITWRGPIPGPDERWRANEKDGQAPPLTRVGQRGLTEPLVLPLEPGRYELRLDARVRLDSTHPAFEVFDGLQIVEDYLETPLEFLAGPVGWLTGTVKDAAVDGMIEIVVDRMTGTRSVWSFEVPAVMPNLAGKTPQAARNLVRLHRLTPIATRSLRPDATTPVVISQRLAAGTKLRAGANAPFTFVTKGAAAPGARPWHGDWRWTYTPKGGSAASPGVMTMFQPSAGKVCLQWPWSPLPDGTLGHGSGTTSAGARQLTFSHTDAFGSGTHTVTLSTDGTEMTGSYQATARADGAKAAGTIRATYVGPPSKRPSC